MPNEAERVDLLATVHYEATRAGLDPELVLAVIHHESGFHKYAVSTADARGYMQVMPFWTRLIGNTGQNLFHLRTNLRAKPRPVGQQLVCSAQHLAEMVTHVVESTGCVTHAIPPDLQRHCARHPRTSRSAFV